jgi:hypothetical protein
MLKKASSLSSVFRKGSLNVALVMILLAVTGLSTVGHYGISYDEEAPIRVAFENFQIVKTGKPYLGHLRHYGTLFNVTSEIGFKLKNKFNKFENYSRDNTYQYVGRGYVIPQFLERAEFKHVMIFLSSLIAYGSIAGIVGILAGLEYAWLGPLTLALFPNFWGHSFFNPKDIPLAVMVTLGTFLGAYLVGYFLKTDPEDAQLGMNRITLSSLFYGVLVGLVAGARVDGSILLLFVAIAHLFTVMGKRSLRREISYFWKFYGLIVVAWLITTVILYPSSWFNPVTWFWETVQFYYAEDWPLTVLFGGQFIPAKALPWDYLPRWLLMTLPEFFQITFLCGLMWIGLKYRALTDLQRVCIILVLLQIFFLPTIAIAVQSTKYDGMRQFLYMVPGIAAIAAVTIAWIDQKIARQKVRLLAIGVAIALLSSVILDMVTLHPYEYLYFNRTFGGLAKAYGQYETDYWALSMRAGMEWINSHADSNAKVISSAPVYASAAFAAPNIDVILYNKSEQQNLSKPFYYIAAPKWQFQEQFPECKVVHQVVRQQTPLTIVKKCIAVLSLVQYSNTKKSY